jgi:hypothetical protein
MRLKNSRAIDDAITNVRNQMYACQNALNAHERERRRQVYMQLRSGPVAQGPGALQDRAADLDHRCDAVRPERLLGSRVTA